MSSDMQDVTCQLLCLTLFTAMDHYFGVNAELDGFGIASLVSGNGALAVSVKFEVIW